MPSVRSSLKDLARRLAPWSLRLVNRSMRYPPYDAGAAAEIQTSVDKVRIASVALALHTIDAEPIEGAIAEVGVYRGDLSRILHKLSPERTLYLFDTFAGFPDSGDDRFQDTSPELVRRRVGEDQSKIKIRAGFFPATAEGLEDERFAFVMLDGDRYEVTLAGLQFFMPRLVKGGYLFAHDYNSPESERGVSRAFADFFGDASRPYVEIPDVWGSVVLRRA